MNNDFGYNLEKLEYLIALVKYGDEKTLGKLEEIFNFKDIKLSEHYHYYEDVHSCRNILKYILNPKFQYTPEYNISKYIKFWDTFIDALISINLDTCNIIHINKDIYDNPDIAKKIEKKHLNVRKQVIKELLPEVLKNKKYIKLEKDIKNKVYLKIFTITGYEKQELDSHKYLLKERADGVYIVLRSSMKKLKNFTSINSISSIKGVRGTLEFYKSVLDCINSSTNTCIYCLNKTTNKKSCDDCRDLHKKIFASDEQKFRCFARKIKRIKCESEQETISKRKKCVLEALDKNVKRKDLKSYKYLKQEIERIYKKNR